MKVPDLRSPYDKTGEVCYFGRLLDKIRLKSRGELPGDYLNNLGKGFDARCLDFLGVDYDRVVQRTLEGETDDEILAWCMENGRRPSESEIFMWNEFMRKFGWNDQATPTLQRRLAEGGFTNRPDIQTIFDYIDLDEERA
jgi:hypothetical protein